MFTAADVPCDVVPGPVLQVAYLEERCLLCSGEVVLCPCVAEFVEEGGLGRTAHLDEVGLVVVGLVAAEGVAAAGSVAGKWITRSGRARPACSNLASPRAATSTSDGRSAWMTIRGVGAGCVSSMGVGDAGTAGRLTVVMG